MQPTVLILLLALLLGGCETLVTLHSPARSLAPPIKEYHHVEQLLTLRWNKQIRRLHCVLITRPGETRVVALTETGLPVFQLLQTPNDVNIDRSPLLPPQISPDEILADIQLILWPWDSVEKSLEPPLKLARHAGYRELYNGDKLEVRVDYSGKDRWNSPATLVNHHYGYRITVQPLSKDDTNERP